MPQDEVSRCGLMQVCSTNDDCLLIKFPTIQQCRLLNSFKKNLPRESKVEDFIPPCLMELERVLISHGDRIRAANSTAAFKVRTRRVWLKGTRVLQGKMSQFHGYQNLLGLEGLGRETRTAELNLLMDSLVEIPGEVLAGAREQVAEVAVTTPSTAPVTTVFVPTTAQPNALAALPMDAPTTSANIRPPNLVVGDLIATSSNDQPAELPPLSQSLLEELRENDNLLNLSAIDPGSSGSTSNPSHMVSTPVLPRMSAFTSLCVKRPAVDFVKAGRQKKQRLQIPPSRSTPAPAALQSLLRFPPPLNDSGLDKSGIDASSMSCGSKLWDESFATPLAQEDGNFSLLSYELSPQLANAPPPVADDVHREHCGASVT